MIKKLYDKCVTWAGYRYAKQILAIEAFIESSFFPIPPDIMIILTHLKNDLQRKGGSQLGWVYYSPQVLRLYHSSF